MHVHLQAGAAHQVATTRSARPPAKSDIRDPDALAEILGEDGLGSRRQRQSPHGGRSAVNPGRARSSLTMARSALAAFDLDAAAEFDGAARSTDADRPSPSSRAGG